MVFDGRYKLIKGFNAEPGAPADESPALLFDLVDDPLENNNLVDEAAHSGIKGELMERLRAWREDTDDYHRLP